MDTTITTITTQPSKILAIISNQAIDLGNNIVRRNADFKNFTYKTGPNDGYDNGKEMSTGEKIAILLVSGFLFICGLFALEKCLGNSKNPCSERCCEELCVTIGNGIARNLELKTSGRVFIRQETVNYENI